MRVMITGAGGQVARALLRCVPAGVQVIALTRADLDIGIERAVLACVESCRPEVIINTAAYTAVDRAESEPEAAERVNVAGARHLAVAARSANSRLLHLSSDYVFDGMTSTPYATDADTNPLNVYGRTKADGERAVREVLPERSGILRTGWVYAQEGRNFVRTLLRALNDAGSARVVTDQVGAPTSAVSLARTIWALAGAPDMSGIFHWTNAGMASWYEFALAIAGQAAALGLLPAGATVVPITSKEYAAPARRPAFSVLQPGMGRLLLPVVHWRVELRSVLGEICAGCS